MSNSNSLGRHSSGSGYNHTCAPNARPIHEREWFTVTVRAFTYQSSEVEKLSAIFGEVWRRIIWSTVNWWTGKLGDPKIHQCAGLDYCAIWHDNEKSYNTPYLSFSLCVIIYQLLASLSHTHTNTHTPPQVLCGQLCVCVSCKDVAGWCVEVEAEGLLFVV